VKVWLDRALAEESEARIAPSDHGLLVGDGVFETLRWYGGKPFALADHLRRLEEGCDVLGLTMPPASELESAAHAVVEANGLGDARMRITVTSGSGPPGLARGDGPPTVLIVALPLAAWPPTASAVVSRLRRDERSPLAGVKTVSLAGGVAALAEALAAGASEALILNTAGELCEATTANVFVVAEGVATTPPLASGCLAGITRAHVLELGASERRLRREDLAAADEIFLTSSTREVQPLVEVDGVPVGDGNPGPVTNRLAEAYARVVDDALGHAS
jgi:branched-chain amino acid aminotransferase